MEEQTVVSNDVIEISSNERESLDSEVGQITAYSSNTLETESQSSIVIELLDDSPVDSDLNENFPSTSGK